MTQTHARWVDGLRDAPTRVAVSGVLLAWITAFVVVIVTNDLGQSNNFRPEAWPSYQQLFHGHLRAFFSGSPAYVGSLLLRAPFTLTAMLICGAPRELTLGGDWRIPYLASALPCVASAPILTAWLLSRRQPCPDRNRWTWLSPLGVLLIANPVFLFCIVMGHPETVLSASLAIAGVAQAARAKAVWAMFLAGAAAVDQPWALAAVPVVFAVLPRNHLRGLLTLAATGSTLAVPVLIAHGSAGASAALGSGTGDLIFYPDQLWWSLGPDSWIPLHAHELIVLAGVLCAAVWWILRHRRPKPEGDRLSEGLVLLALVLLLRAAMDPWDNVYYQLPFLMAVYALELGRPPKLSALLTLLMFAVTFPLDASHVNPNLQALIYQLVSAAMIVLLCLRLYAPTVAARFVRHGQWLVVGTPRSAPDRRRPRSSSEAAR